MLSSLVFLVIPPAGWGALVYHLTVLLVVLLLSGMAWRGAGSRSVRIAATLVGGALAASRLFLITQVVFEAGGTTGSPALSQALFNCGELLLVLGGAALWWAYGRGASRKIQGLAAVITLLFAGMRLASPAMTGILTIWSTGLTLYLPWPLYAAALWMMIVAACASIRRGEAAGWAMLLLMAGGFAPQLNVNTFFGLIGLWLLASPEPLPLENLRPEHAAGGAWKRFSPSGMAEKP
jgi:hypothetical protein